ncbi:alpha/beta hydrolase [Streptomyces sp. B1866]|uniref:alpha/beta hydrolase family protein n=1 Tax=Streptomyces sp. B1866 TaxID=3075431 RepID=UPI002890F95F|nr:alpha/beta hydrolase [Streptomyces sp. B1866]MDT3397399.1 alpha/beta hydrolase [Streptomyces sp. B1866]
MLTATLLLAGGALVGTSAVGTATAGPAVAGAQATAVSTAAGEEFRRGPDPTRQSVEAARGTFQFEEISVPRGNGFGGGTIYAPTDTSQGTFGAIAIAPGFLESKSAISWYGPKLASNGFVVFAIDTNSPIDFPNTRGTELLAALDYLTKQSKVASRIDVGRLAVAGHSMGGGGSLEAVNTRPELKAAIALAPWHPRQGWDSVTAPTLIVGGQNDGIAPVNQHAKPFYNGLTSAREKAYLEMKGGDHFVVTKPNTTIGRYVLSWAKRYVDNDSRYEQFLCPAPAVGGDISDYRGTCPTG